MKLSQTGFNDSTSGVRDTYPTIGILLLFLGISFGLAKKRLNAGPTAEKKLPIRHLSLQSSVVVTLPNSVVPASFRDV